MSRSIAALALMGLTAGSATAGVVVFEDTFNTENAGAAALNYAGFTQWTVSDGTVDLIGNGVFDYYPGNGLYIDLDGSTSDAGVLTSTSISLIPGDYTLEFDLGGRPDEFEPNTVRVSLGGFIDQTLTRTFADPLATVTIPFTVGSAASASIVFSHAGGDNFGLLLDDVRLTLVPAPGAASLALLAALPAARRRR